jgi:hypothetical protein
MVSRAVLALVVLASLAACNGGTFFDPGHDAAYGFGNGGGGGGSRGGTKPSTLSSGATYGDVNDKLAEIYYYCEDHSGTANNAIKKAVEMFSEQLFEYLDYDANVNKSAPQSVINSVNAFISQLQ